jgi:ABC-2 type transport system ATP-binding protein
VTVGADDGGAGLTDALRSVEAAGIEIEDIALRQPTLDEVFLALTGQPITDDQSGVRERAAS